MSKTSHTMRVPLLDLKAQHALLREELRAAFERVLDSQQFILGEDVRLLEAEVARYCGTRHAVGCASGTDALLLALLALGVAPGDEVITTPFTFFATASSIHRAGATPRFVDIEPRTCNLDPAEVARAPRTRRPLHAPAHGGRTRRTRHAPSRPPRRRPHLPPVRRPRPRRPARPARRAPQTARRRHEGLLPRPAPPPGLLPPP